MTSAVAIWKAKDNTVHQIRGRAKVRLFGGKAKGSRADSGVGLGKFR